MTADDLLEQRKSLADCDIFEKSFESELTVYKGKEQTSPEPAEFIEKKSDRDRKRPSEFCYWFRGKISWIRSLFATCRKRKSRK